MTSVPQPPGETFTAGNSDGPSVLLIGDSSMAGLRWYDGVAEHLTGASYIVDVESCRRVAQESCVGREGVAPTSVVEALRVAAVTDVDVLVVMAGYNEDGNGFEERVRFIGEAAERLGIRERIWMRFTSPDPMHSSVDTTSHNRALDLVAAEQQVGWTIGEWPAHAAQSTDIFEQDGIHLTRNGAVELAEFVTDVVVTVTEPTCRSSPAPQRCPALEHLRLTR